MVLDDYMDSNYCCYSNSHKNIREEQVMYTRKETSRRPVDGAMVTWSWVDSGPPHTSEVKGKTIVHWQPKRWVPVKVDYKK
tara:strand:+ start:396 stop:638 length:243 start_codon:yes stop_codon:yes gene_type:complete